jgi:hypothetical protein
MFKEIAVEPAAVSTSYRDFAYITEKFGIAEGRLIAAFPNKWKRSVYQTAQAQLRGTKDLSKLEVRLKAMSEDVFYARGRPGEGCADDWLKAAVSEHARQPFDAIIANSPSDADVVIAAAELDGQHPCLQPNRQWHIERRADLMASCCAPLLASAKHIKLVDPHFDAGQPRFRRPFLEFLRHAKPGSRVDVFRGDGQDRTYIAQRMEQALQGTSLPPGLEVRLFLKPQGDMHNRYLLTAAGGVYFLTGLDDRGNDGIATDEVGVLETSVWAVQWARYCGTDPIVMST